MASKSERSARSETIPLLEHVAIEFEDGRGVCTLFPHDCPSGEYGTHWITARDDAFVRLENAC